MWRRSLARPSFAAHLMHGNVLAAMLIQNESTNNATNFGTSDRRCFWVVGLVSCGIGGQWMTTRTVASCVPAVLYLIRWFAAERFLYCINACTKSNESKGAARLAQLIFECARRRGIDRASIHKVHKCMRPEQGRVWASLVWATVGNGARWHNCTSKTFAAKSVETS